MEEVAHLIIRVSADQADAAKAKLKQLGYTAKETETATGSLMSAWKGLTGLLAGAAGVGTAISALVKLRDVATQFESLEAQLKTATGSAQNAKLAFGALQDFAVDTPYDLAQTVDAFIKLTNLGLTPSERALKSYGNTASALGKRLDEMVRAVANSTVGEFETLKAFGIKARTEADGIAFTFQGVTTKVKNSAKDIESYFITLGESKFGNAMSERMVTLEGKLSNLGDAWDVLFATIAKNGAGDLMKQAIDAAIDGLTELTAMIASGQLAGYIDALLFKFESLSDGVYNAFENISGLLDDAFKYWTSDGKGAVDFLIGAFKNMPENIRTLMRGVGATFGLLVEYAEVAGKNVWETFSAWFGYLLKTAENVGKEIWSHLNPKAADFDFQKAQAEAFDQFAKRSKNSWETLTAGIGNATDAWSEEITATMNERDIALKAFAEKIGAANQLRAAYEALRAARAKAGEGKDRLEQFGIGGKSATAEFETMVKAMRSHAEVLRQTYEKRKQLILDNTAAESDARRAALARNEQIYEEERKQLLDRAAPDVEFRLDIIADQNALELAAVQNAYAERQKALDEALAAQLITQEEYGRRSTALEDRRIRDIELLTTNGLIAVQTKQLTAYQQVLGMAATLNAQMGELVKGNNDAAKALFVVGKAIAIAQAVVNTELAATQALTMGPILGIPASALIRGLGYASVAVMAAQSVMEYNGRFEHGGMIPAGKVGMTQEAGFELVRGPAVVSSARSTADMLAGSRGGGDVFVSIHNNAPGVEVEERHTQTEDGKLVEFIVKQSVKAVANDIRGGTQVISALQERTNLRRVV